MYSYDSHTSIEPSWQLHLCSAGAVISYDDFKNRVSVRWAMAVQFNSYAHLRDVPSIVTLMIGYPPFL